MAEYVLISWLDRKDDPYIREGDRVVMGSDSKPRPGPVHGVVLDSESPFVHQFTAGVLLATREPSEARPDEDTRDRFRTLTAMIEQSAAPFPIKLETLAIDNPTDHSALFTFCLDIIGKVRTAYPSAHLVVNTSSGTPAMHTVWVLLSETRQIDGEYTLVQGIPPHKRAKKNPTSVASVRIGLDSAFGNYRQITIPTGTGYDEGVVDLSRAQSPILKKLYADAKLYATANIPLLILGERGSGKTELAKFVRGAYHAARGTQASANWPVVNSGQFRGDPNSMRSELFGHVAGAYTGALAARDGILKEVDGDVLFLDEIADLDRTSQRLLIRAIEEKAYAAYGGSETIDSDFRLVSATNRPLNELREGELDADFFDRISTLRLQAPALREIPEDLDWIWDNVLATTARRAAIAHVDIREGERAAIVSRLRTEKLPGNYRDLIRLASHVLLFLGTESHFPTRAAALDAAFEHALEAPTSSLDDPSRELARRYANNDSLRDLLAEGFDVPGALDAFRSFLGREIRAHLNKKDVQNKTGIAYETANSWRKVLP